MDDDLKDDLDIPNDDIIKVNCSLLLMIEKPQPKCPFQYIDILYRLHKVHSYNKLKNTNITASLCIRIFDEIKSDKLVIIQHIRINKIAMQVHHASVCPVQDAYTYMWSRSP